jgi:hypothetical protein
MRAPADPPSAEGALEPDADSVDAKARATSEDREVAACEVTLESVDAATADVLALPPPGASAAATPWDHKTAPARLDLVDRRYALTADERARLFREGFVVPARLSAVGWADALHDLWQSELPIWISADAILHAVYASNDRIVARIEETYFADRLAAALDAMHCTLPRNAVRWPKEVAHDVDLYLTVARSLLAGVPAPSAMGTDAEAALLVAEAMKADRLAALAIFGRDRLVDFTQYAPRGHYNASPRLSAVFRAEMWLSRLEFNVVSRSSRSSANTAAPDPRETPREAVDALALAELAESAGAAAAIAALDRVWGALAGKREDLGLADLSRLRAARGIGALTIPASADELRAAVGDGWKRTARLHPMPEGSTELPVITTFLGPRVTADTVATRPLVHSAVPDRHMVGAPDLAYVLGSDRALAHMTRELAAHPTLGAALPVARGLAQAPGGEDLYGAWLAALRGLFAPAPGARPSFMSGPAFADLRIDAAVAGYAQLRHNNVALVGQGYDEGGCAIPDAWVDPAPAVYDALLDYARRGKELAAVVDATGGLNVGAYFARLERTLRVLRAIVAWELAGQPLPRAAARWLSLVVELRPYGGTGGPPSFTGWWFDLFRLRQEGLTPPELVADAFTSVADGEVLYLGAARPNLGIFVVDSGGPPRVVVGPVARAVAHVAPLARRLTDADLTTVASASSAPWEASYTAPAPAIPPLEIKTEYPPSERKPKTLDVFVRSTRAVGPVTVEALDHHRKPYAAVTHSVGAAFTRFSFSFTRLRARGEKEDAPLEIDGVRARVGDARIELLRPHGGWKEEEAGAPIDVVFGGMPATAPQPPP